MRVDGVGRYTLLGETIDDAAGEAFDKSRQAARASAIPAARRFRGWPSSAIPTAFKLPRPLLHSGDLDFCFAGLKTAVLHAGRMKLGDELRAGQGRISPRRRRRAIVDVLVREVARGARARPA